MGLAQRVQRRVTEAVEGHLAAGERLVAAAIATRSRPRRQLLLGLLSPLLSAVSQRPYYVALTDQRLLLLRPGLRHGTVAEEVLADPHQTIELEEARHGLLRSVLVLRRQPSGERWRLELGRSWREEAEAIAGALGGGS